MVKCRAKTVSQIAPSLLEKDRDEEFATLVRVVRLVRVVFVSLLFPMFVCALFASILSADDREDGRKALQDASSFPWYDSQSDALKQVPLEKMSEDEPVSPDGKRKLKPKKSKTKSSTNTGGGTGGGGPSGTGDFSMISGLLWVFISMGLLLLVGVLVWAFLMRESDDESRLESMIGQQQNMSDEERIENLPFQVRKGTGSMRDSAQAAYESGNYREAMIFLYSHMLVQLDRKQWIRLHRSRTNRQYLNDVRRNRSLTEIFRDAMLKFESAFFGSHEIDRESFEAIWKSLDEFNRAMETPSGETA